MQHVTDRSEASLTDDVAHSGPTMAIPHFINDDRSEMRGIKPGWYAVEDDGNLSAGPFSSHAQCLIRLTQPANDSVPSELCS